MAEVKESRDMLKNTVIKVTAQGQSLSFKHSNRKTAVKIVLDCAIALLYHFSKELNASQKANVNGLVYRLIEEEV